MILSEHSRNRLLTSLDKWHVDKDFADPIYNYLVYGFEPGSCFTAVLANDFARAIQASHPANTIEAFKRLVGWIWNQMPAQCFGSYEAVKMWTKLTADQRRAVLEAHGMIYTTEEETWLVLKNAPTMEPMFY